MQLLLYLIMCSKTEVQVIDLYILGLYFYLIQLKSHAVFEGIYVKPRVVNQSFDMYAYYYVHIGVRHPRVLLQSMYSTRIIAKELLSIFFRELCG